MPESLTREEVTSKTDPSVSKQWDDETPKKEQLQDFYKICDSLKVCLLGTNRPGVGPVHRSMAVGKRVGPDLYVPFRFFASFPARFFYSCANLLRKEICWPMTMIL